MAESVSSSSTGRSLIKVPSGKVSSPYFARTKMPSSVVSSNSPAAKKAVSSFAFSVSVFSVSIFSFFLSRKLEGDSFEISSLSSFSAGSASVPSEASPSIPSCCGLLSDAKNAPSCDISSVLSPAYAICTLLKLSTAHKNAESTLFPTPFPENFNIPSPYSFLILSAASALYHELFFLYIFFNKSFNVHKSFYYFHKIGSLAFRQDPFIS